MTSDYRTRAQAQPVRVRWGDSIPPRRIDYLWRGYLARGKLTAIGGDPGAGKGTLGIDLAARLSRGGAWPDGTPCPIGKVLLLTGEDNPEDTIIPRAIAAYADVSRVGVIDRIEADDGTLRRPSLDTDAEALMAKAATEGADVVIIDPLSSYLGGNTNSWRDSDMRRVLDPLAEAAARHHIAVILVAHLNKSGGGKAMYRYQGNIASIGAARFAFLVAAHPQDPDRRVLAAIKTNLAKLPPSLSFRIVGQLVESVDDELGRVEWTGAVSLTADDLVAERKVDAQQRAADFLLEVLAAGPLPSEQVKALAKDRGIGINSVWRAKDELAVHAQKVGVDGWEWVLPPRDGSALSNHHDKAVTLHNGSVQSGTYPPDRATDSPSEVKRNEASYHHDSPPSREREALCPECGRETRGLERCPAGHDINP